MRTILILILFFVNSFSCFSQSNYTEALQQGDDAYNRGDYKLAINKYFAAEAFDPSKKEITKARVNKVFDKIVALRKEADYAKSMTNDALLIAEREKKKALELKDLSEKEKKNADSAKAEAISEKNKAKIQTITTYANNLAYKSQISLREGDRNTAIRLAEFAFLYVDSMNNTVQQALSNAIFYNENVTNTPLPNILNLEGHTNTVTSISFSSDCKRLVSGSNDNIAKVWDLESGKLLKNLEGHLNRVLNVNYSTDCKHIATGAMDNTAKIWDAESGEALHTTNNLGSPVLLVSFMSSGKKLVIVTQFHGIKIWDLETWMIYRTLKGSDECIQNAGFSSDGKLLVTSNVENNMIRIWNVESGKIVSSLKRPQDKLTSLSVTSDGKLLSVGASDGKVQIWNIKSKKVVRNLFGHIGIVTSVCFSPDGKRIATASDDASAKIWDVNSGVMLQNLPSLTRGIYSLSFSQNGKRLAAGSFDKTVKIWQIDNRKFQHCITRNIVGSNCVGIARDGRRFAISYPDGIVKILDLASGIEIQRLITNFIDIKSLYFSTDDKLILTCSDNKAYLWDIESGCVQRKFWNNNVGKTRGIIASNNFKNLIKTDFYGWVTINKIENGIHLMNINTRNAGANSLCMSSDGKLLVTEYGDGTAEIWDIECRESKHFWVAHNGKINSAKFSSDGTLLATGGWDCSTKIWDVKSGREIRNLRSHSGEVTSLNFSNDGEFLLTGSNDRIVKIWDIKSGDIIRTFSGHKGRITYMDFINEGKQLITLAVDDSLKIWDFEIGLLLRNAKEIEKFADLNFPKLQQYHLDELMKLNPNNLNKLIATKEVWQIKAFADLAAHVAEGISNLQISEPNYREADRLYYAANELQPNEQLIKMDYAKMLRSWAAEYKNNGLLEKAKELNIKANILWIENELE